ncbi:probable galacturonosyltransferase 7 isoform X1 [Coffea eugenioides]|uniref:probable galacturonosyltransferase 7 isoform X1 n=1 Tax=Coffea eugenioides TaxID=49369 RepID=UPI000F612E60|nr:probable galacturonosyltransferase 7 isoform X1 [Coffea eugenioides]
MKGAVGGGGGGSSYTLPGKRRWKGLVIGVLGLVLLSMLVPLVFLLGLHNSFQSHSGFDSGQQISGTNDITIFGQTSDADTKNNSTDEQSRHVDDLIRRLEPTRPKFVSAQDFRRNSVEEAKNRSNALILLPDMPKPGLKANKNISTSKVEMADSMKGSSESKNICELRFGSYCLWRQEHRERMKDHTVKKMKDLLYVARAYYPSIAKLSVLDKLSHELKQNIQDFERVLSETTADKDLPPQIEKKLDKMESTVARAKSHPVDCNNVDKKFRQLVDLTEDEANFHMKQSAFLYQLTVQTMPKSLHCLSLRLTVEYFRSPPPDMELLLADKFQNPDLHHFVIFSNNILASSAVINSTVMNSKETSSQVFHVLTDRQNYFAMKLWFFQNKYKDATVRVLDIEGLKLDEHEKLSQVHQLLPEEFRVSFRSVDKLSRVWVQTEYFSLFSQSHYLLPDIFPTLRKVMILDDDIIVQKDLSALWSLDMGEKVIGAVMVCTVRLVQLQNYLGENNFDEQSCAWMSGLNIVDLGRWRKLDLTKSFERLVLKLTPGGGISEAAAVPATLLTFQGLVYDLDDNWVLSGLGYNYGLDPEIVKKAAVLHFNGNMKPWLELGIPKYKGFWRNFLNPENTFLSNCNANQ